MLYDDIKAKLGNDVVIISDRHWREFLSNYSDIKIHKMVEDGMFGIPVDLHLHEKRFYFKFWRISFSWLSRRASTT